MGTLTVGDLEIPDSYIILDLPRDAHGVVAGLFDLVPVPEPAAGIQPDMVWDVTVWDNQLWEGDTVAVDVSCDAVAVSWRRGGGVGNHYDAGTATLVLHNPDGRYTPDYTRYQTGSGVRVGASQLTIIVNDQQLFTGRVSAFEEQFVPGEPPQVVASATDYWEDLNVNLPALTTPTPQQTVLERLDTILDRANWPPERNGLPTTNYAYYISPQLQASDLAQDLMTEAKKVADHRTNGEYNPYRIYLDAEGVFRITTTGYDVLGYGAPSHDHPTVSEVPGYWPVLHFSDCPEASDGGSEQWVYWQTAPLQVGVDLDTVENDVTLARVGGTEQRAENEESIAHFGRRTWGRNDLLYIDNVTVLDHARTHVRASAWPYQHVSQIVVDIGANSRAPLPAWAWVIEWLYLFEMYVHVTVEHRVHPRQGVKSGLLTAKGRVVNVDASLNRDRGTVTLTLETTPELWWD